MLSIGLLGSFGMFITLYRMVNRKASR
jgi:hypothetical protein